MKQAIDLDCGFLPKHVYLGKDGGSQYFLLVLKTAVESDYSYESVHKAVFGVLFDISYTLISVRWFRVSSRGGIYVAHGSNIQFYSNLPLSRSADSYPPDAVIDDFFLQASRGLTLS